MSIFEWPLKIGFAVTENPNLQRQVVRTCVFAPLLNYSNKFCTSHKHVCIFIGEKNETNIHLEQAFYLLTKTWKYGGCVFGTEKAGGADLFFQVL